MATISDFKAQLSGGGARPNQFRVELTFPSFAVQGDLGRASQFLAKSAQLPASTVEDITTYFRGRPVHFAGERTFAPWTIAVYNEVNFTVRNSLEIWQDAVLNYDATNGLIAPADYQVDMRVSQLDRNDNVIKVYDFFDAYPTSIGAIALDYETNNQLEQFDVEFVYNYFTTSF